ncbi:MAG: alanine--tRNA ligase [Clostridia bacterium]
MKAIDIREKYLKFFESKGHKIISGAALVPENDPTVLFTTAGMHPLVPYLTGQNHPEGTRLTDYQKCLRTDDIDEVGDNRHLTFFEMLGNWSLGDYFKEESIAYSYEFLTKELNIPSDKIYITCFAGDSDAPRDEEAANIWKECGIKEEQIYYFGKEDNWWICGACGPCGPDTEIFYDTGVEKCSKECNPSCDCGKYIEIWNNVFMQYNKLEDGTYLPLEKKNVDTGMGLERITYLLQGKDNVFETELFSGIIKKVNEDSKVPSQSSVKIIADHMRASALLIADGVRPSNVGQGYILRRLIRRTVRHMKKIGFDSDNIADLCNTLVDNLGNMYPELEKNRENIKNVLNKEKNKFMNTLVHGEREFIKIIDRLKLQDKHLIDGTTLFRLYDTYGFPPEVTGDLAKENEFEIDMKGFDKCFEEHQKKSRQGLDAGVFKGGLADTCEQTTKYHTATHLILKSLQNILGDHVVQKGSNITGERIRFDFSNPEKVQRDVLDKVEAMVNEQIDKCIPVICEEMTLEDARKSGAKGIFDNKYGEHVKVYSIGEFSKEICGGPHVENTSKLEHIKIKKEESVSSGVRRIKAVFVKNE